MGSRPAGAFHKTIWASIINRCGEYLGCSLHLHYYNLRQKLKNLGIYILEIIMYGGVLVTLDKYVQKVCERLKVYMDI